MYAVPNLEVPESAVQFDGPTPSLVSRPPCRRRYRQHTNARPGGPLIAAVLALALGGFAQPACGQEQIFPSVVTENNLIRGEAEAIFSYTNNGSDLPVFANDYAQYNYFLVPGKLTFPGQPTFFETGTHEDVFLLPLSVSESSPKFITWVIVEGTNETTTGDLSESPTVIRTFTGGESVFDTYTHTAGSDPIPSAELRVQDGATFNFQGGVFGEVINPGEVNEAFVGVVNTLLVDRGIKRVIGGAPTDVALEILEVLPGEKSVANLLEGTLKLTVDPTIPGSGILTVGEGGEFNARGGMLDVKGAAVTGGAMNIQTDLSMSTFSQQAGVTNLLGGELTVGTFLNVSDGGEFRALGGTLNTNLANVDAGGRLVAFGGEHDLGFGLDNAGETVFTDTVIHGKINNKASSATTILGLATFQDEVSGPGNFFGPGTVLFNGGYSPGDSPAVVSVAGNVAFGPGNLFEVELGGVLPGESDALFVDGNVVLDGTLSLSLLSDFTPASGQMFGIIDVGGSLSGQFLGLDEGAVVGTFGQTPLWITYMGGDGNDVVLTAVPETVSLVLVLAAAGLTIAFRRRRVCS